LENWAKLSKGDEKGVIFISFSMKEYNYFLYHIL
jgi:hypothetical protein